MTDERVFRVNAHRPDDLFSTLVGLTRDEAICLLDPDGLILTWNEGAERVFGWLVDEEVGRPYTILKPEPEVFDGGAGREVEIAAQRGRFEGESMARRRDGTLFRASMTLLAIPGEDGSPRAFGLRIRDLSER